MQEGVRRGAGEADHEDAVVGSNAAYRQNLSECAAGGGAQVRPSRMGQSQRTTPVRAQHKHRRTSAVSYSHIRACQGHWHHVRALGTAGQHAPRHTGVDAMTRGGTHVCLIRSCSLNARRDDRSSRRARKACAEGVRGRRLEKLCDARCSSASSLLPWTLQWTWHPPRATAADRSSSLSMVSVFTTEAA